MRLQFESAQAVCSAFVLVYDPGESRGSIMDLSPEELEAASAYVLAVRQAVLTAVGDVSSPAVDPLVVLMSSLDGMIAAAAMAVSASGVAPTLRERRRLADEVRTGFLKAMKEADSELAGGTLN
jgi:hypothetical protein